MTQLRFGSHRQIRDQNCARALRGSTERFVFHKKKKTNERDQTIHRGPSGGGWLASWLTGWPNWITIRQSTRELHTKARDKIESREHKRMRWKIVRMASLLTQVALTSRRLAEAWFRAKPYEHGAVLFQ